MSLFDKMKKIGKIIQEDVKKIPTDDIKERLSDVKNVLSESYNETREKLEEKNKIRNSIIEEFNLLKLKLTYTETNINGFSNYLEPDKEDILEMYKSKIVRSYNDIQNLPFIKYKGLYILKPNSSLDVLPVSCVDIKTIDNKESKEVLKFEIEEPLFDNKEQSVQNEVLLSKETVETEENENTLKLGDLNKEELNKEELNETEVNLSDNINSLNYYIILDYNDNYEKLIDLVWKNILILRECEILELNFKNIEAEKLVEKCILCNSSNHIDSFVYKDKLICSEKCYKTLQNTFLTLNNSKKGIEFELKVLNNSNSNSVIQELFNNLKLNDLKINNWITLPNSFVLKNELSNGEILYVGYDIICKVNTDGILEVIVYKDLLNKTDKINDFILINEDYKVLECIFNKQ